jgi:hypothetical protein
MPPFAKPPAASAGARRFRRQRAAYARGEITLDELHAGMRAWIAHAAHGDTWGLRGALLNAA